MISSIKTWLLDPFGVKQLRRRVALLEELLDEEREAHRRDIRYEWHKAEQHFDLRTKQLQAENKALMETIVKFHNTHPQPVFVAAGSLTKTAPASQPGRS